MISVRTARSDDRDPIKRIAVDAGLFTADDVEMFDEMLDGFFDGSLVDHSWLVAERGGAVVGGAYVAPEPFGDAVWNLYFLAVDPDAQGSGAGTTLIEEVEALLKGFGAERARVLIVETSSIDQYEPTRAFYARRGFDEESTIREFYGPGDSKVTFWKSLTT